MQLTNKQLMKACCRALYLWEFGDDDVDEGYRLSDRQMLQYFGGIWTRAIKQNKQVKYNKPTIHKLIKSCKVWNSQVRNPNLPNISFFLNDSVTRGKYTKALANSLKQRVRWQYGADFTTELSKELNANRRSAYYVKGYGNQRAFASRILFFAMPQIHCYNYTIPLKVKLKNHCVLADEKVDTVFQLMNDLFVAHEKELRALPRPNFGDAKGLGKAIREGDWWERRVLDLAVLQNWKCFCKD
jgi:hypothetical protein